MIDCDIESRDLIAKPYHQLCEKRGHSTYEIHAMMFSANIRFC